MTRPLLALLLATAAAGPAAAQVYGLPGTAGPRAAGNPLVGLNGAFAPNFYNRAQQPLSPYLNLLRGRDPAVNYYYGVRPGTSPLVSGLGGGFGLGPPAGVGPAGGGNQFYLQPGLLPGDLPSQPLDASQPIVPPVLPSAAHPLTFGTGPGIGRVNPRTAFGAAPAGLQTPARGGTPPAPRRR